MSLDDNNSPQDVGPRVLSGEARTDRDSARPGISFASQIRNRNPDGTVPTPHTRYVTSTGRTQDSGDRGVSSPTFVSKRDAPTARSDSGDAEMDCCDPADAAHTVDAAHSVDAAHTGDADTGGIEDEDERKVAVPVSMYPFPFPGYAWRRKGKLLLCGMIGIGMLAVCGYVISRTLLLK